jgi:hypothetical protein
MQPLTGNSAASEFQNYLFFLYHFRELVRRQRGATRLDILRRIETEQAPRFAHVARRQLNDRDHATIRKYLFTAWNAEAVSRLPAGFDPEVLQFTNQWKPVQAYYSIYFHLVTLHFAVNARVPRQHEPTLRYTTQNILPWFPRRGAFGGLTTRQRSTSSPPYPS